MTSGMYYLRVLVINYFCLVRLFFFPSLSHYPYLYYLCIGTCLQGGKKDKNLNRVSNRRLISDVKTEFKSNLNINQGLSNNSQVSADPHHS